MEVVKNVSRRQFAGLVSGTGIALAVLPVRAVLGQSLISGPKPVASPVTTNLLSNAVVVSATAHLTNTVNRIQSKTLQSADLAGALVAVRTLFDNMKETGVSTQITKAILVDQISFVNTGFTQAQIDTQYATISKAGMNIASSAYRNSLITNTTQRQQVITMLKTTGIDGAAQQFLAKLSLAQNQIATDRVGSLRPAIPTAYTTHEAHVMRVHEISTCELGAAIFAGGAFFFPPLALVAACYALEAALGWC